MKLINTLILTCGLLFTGCTPTYKEQVDTMAWTFKTDEIVHMSSINFSFDGSILFRDTNGAVYIAIYNSSNTNNFIKQVIFPPLNCK